MRAAGSGRRSFCVIAGGRFVRQCAYMDSPTPSLSSSPPRAAPSRRARWLGRGLALGFAAALIALRLGTSAGCGRPLYMAPTKAGSIYTAPREPEPAPSPIRNPDYFAPTKAGGGWSGRYYDLDESPQQAAAPQEPEEMGFYSRQQRRYLGDSEWRRQRARQAESAQQPAGAEPAVEPRGAPDGESSPQVPPSGRKPSRSPFWPSRGQAP
jgi:hypothetical protein